MPGKNTQPAKYEWFTLYSESVNALMDLRARRLFFLTSTTQTTVASFLTICTGGQLRRIANLRKKGAP